ncbi:MAG: NFACT RNA binding domain-containing protein [Longimicrobiales bacterium]|nr:NFACT RNA binding domain-containing protein [Longimicrobiales bacterium]
MRIQWDATLVAATARALRRRLRGGRVRAWQLDPVARRFTLYLREETVVWELHPTRLGLHLLAPVDPPAEARRLPARVVDVTAPPDDRVLSLALRRLRGAPARVDIHLELLPNQENAVLTEGSEGTVRALLRTRTGERPLRRGGCYHPPPPSGRAGATGDLPQETWAAVLSAPPDERRRVLLREVAWTSPLVADALLAEGGRTLWDDLRARVSGPETGPPPPASVVLGRHGPQPYPLSLPERTLHESRDLLEAFRVAEAESADGGSAPLLPGALLRALEAAEARAHGRVARLEEERAGLPDPDRLQGWGDLLLARFREVPTGADHALLEGFDGTPVRVPLDPVLTADANARRHYDRAARVRRAREELPGRIREARAVWERLRTLAERARSGDATREEVAAALPEVGDASRGEDVGERLPFHRFRSSGGLEIRVGRGAAANDDLTFHHARPGDVWLHARHAAGAHVILRWEGTGAPPARDLEEAAVLAALHSRARTSGSVPVDWTLRKHVRKPRRAPAGAVVPDRVRTLFVTPDEDVRERLRAE